MAGNQMVAGNTGKMKALISSAQVNAKLENLLGKESGTFLASVLDLYTGDSNLNRCDATKVMAECMKAAALKMPISKSLGFCYVIPYGNQPQFQMGYRGLIQLAQRSGQYKYINADVIYEGEKADYNRVTGMLEITGEKTSDKPVAYFAYFQLLNGFEKAVFWTKEKVEAHARKYSKAWSKADSPWHTNFDAMALKTVITALLGKYGVMSVEFANAIAADEEADTDREVAEKANKAPIIIQEEESENEAVGNVEIEPESVENTSDDPDSDPGF